MDETVQQPYQPDVSFDGGDLDCGSGLLLLIRKHIDPLARGQILEVRSTEVSVEQDLPSWCRLTGNELISWNRDEGTWSFLICKGSLSEKTESPTGGARLGAERKASELRISAFFQSVFSSSDSIAIGDGHRKLAATAVDAPGDARAC